MSTPGVPDGGQPGGNTTGTGGAGVNTRSLPPIPQTNVKAYNHHQLKDAVDAAQPTDVSSVASGWAALGEQMTTFATSLAATANNTNAKWRGSAGEQARTSLLALASWSDSTGQGLQTMGISVDSQSAAASTVQSSMPEKVPVYDPAVYYQRLLNASPAEWPSIARDAREHYDQYQAAEEAAHTAAAAYSTALSDSAATMPAFSPPPTIGSNGGIDEGGIKPPPGGVNPPGGSSYPGGVGPTGGGTSLPPATNPGPWTGSQSTSGATFTPAGGDRTPPAGTGPRPLVPGYPGGPGLPPGSPGPGAPGFPGFPGGVPSGPGSSSTRHGTGLRPGFGPGTGVGRGFGAGTGAGTGAGAGAGAGSGRFGGPGEPGRAFGPGSGAGALAGEGPLGRPGAGTGAAGARGGAGAGGFPIGAGHGQGEEDKEHQRPSYLVETDDVWGDTTLVAPPVIGEAPPEHYRRGR
jgi:hypothetical protein